MKKIGVLTSGGDSPGMNAAIRAVVRCGIEADFDVYGIYRGYEGLIDGEIEKLERGSVGDIMQRGGTILKTARSKRFMEEKGVDRAVSIIEAFELDAIVVIGGDGSMKGAKDLAERGIPVMCIPGTIDNDLGYTDFTIGFDTAVNTVLDAISKIRDTSSSHERTTVIEVMGRNCGDICLFAGLAGGAERILVPEIPIDVNEICKKIVMDGNKGKTHSVIVIAEGASIDSTDLVKEISRITGKEARLVVLSYLQRGGSPTLSDRILATQCGAKVIELLKEIFNHKNGDLLDCKMDIRGSSACGLENSQAIGTIRGEIVSLPLDKALEEKREFDLEKLELIDILAK